MAGTASEQFIDAAAWAAVWFRLMAAPAPSTGLVATSPSWKLAIVPLANELAGGTVAPALVLVAVARRADGLAVALAVADPVAVGVAVGLPPFW